MRRGEVQGPLGEEGVLRSAESSAYLCSRVIILRWNKVELDVKEEEAR